MQLTGRVDSGGVLVNKAVNKTNSLPEAGSWWGGRFCDVTSPRLLSPPSPRHSMIWLLWRWAESIRKKEWKKGEVSPCGAALCVLTHLDSSLRSSCLSVCLFTCDPGSPSASTLMIRAPRSVTDPRVPCVCLSTNRLFAVRPPVCPSVAGGGGTGNLLLAGAAEQCAGGGGGGEEGRGVGLSSSSLKGPVRVLPE